jgi:hypothetical protein
MRQETNGNAQVSGGSIAVGTFSGGAARAPETWDRANQRLIPRSDPLVVTVQVREGEKGEIETNRKQNFLDTFRTKSGLKTCNMPKQT